MRDAARIAPFVGKFMALWFRHQDLRFFQLVSYIESRMKEAGYKDGFYAEEPVILKFIDQLLEE